MSDRAELAGADFVLTQDADSCDEETTVCQELTVKIFDAGGGKYVVLKTDRWALDNIDAFADTLRKLLAFVEQG